MNWPFSTEAPLRYEGFNLELVLYSEFYKIEQNLKL